MKIEFGQQNYDVFKRKKVRGINGFVKVVHTAPNVPFVTGAVDLTKTFITIKLTRSGRTMSICEGPFLPLVQETAIGVASFAYNSPVYGLPVILTPAAVGVQEQGLFPFNIDFGRILDLREDDELVVNFQSTGADASAAVDLNLSYYVINICEGAGFEAGVPRIITQVIQPGESNRSYPVEGRVNRVVFINADMNSKNYSDQVVLSINVNNQDLSLNDTYEELLSKNSSYMSEDDFTYLGQSMILFKTDREVLNSEINIQFNSANVNGGKNFLVWRTVNVDELSVKRTQQSIQSVAPTVAEIAVMNTGRPLVN